MFKVIFVYINEAHAVDIWPIGLSAGTLNYSHKIIEDRQNCAIKFSNTFDFNIDTYLDNMNNDIQNVFSCWPFRYFIIEYKNDENVFRFKKIGEPNDSEFDLTQVFE